MKAAIVTAAGKIPTYGDFSDPSISNGEILINVTAASLNQLTKSRASGKHYSAVNQFPFVAGVDGVGYAENGTRLYFTLPTAPFGSMAEKTIVPTSLCIKIPDELDDLTAAAIANPGMSSWAALKDRAQFNAGETVLINGATGASGKLALQIAKYMGAKKIIATGRNSEVLNSLTELGADVIIRLTDDGAVLEEEFKKQLSAGVDVVLDYLWGKSAERLLIAAASAGKKNIKMRFIQIGSISGLDITLPGAILRSSDIKLMGSGIGSVPLTGLIKSISELFVAATKNNFAVAAKAIPLTAVEETWSSDHPAERIVFTIN